MTFTLTARVVNVVLIQTIAYIKVQGKTTFEIAIVNVNVVLKKRFVK